MKRHPALQPFSRDHNVGLVFARRIERGDAVAEEFAKLWAEELDAHFRDEEALLGPLVGDDTRNRLVAEHRAIRELAESVATADLGRLGRLLDAHIRWEERELFPAIEASASEAELAALGRRTTVIEATRSSSTWAPRRGELNRSRQQNSTD
ncbi:MAG: hemerythrin domain-containing protein [Fimbriimonadaceae bacterium]|nr:hemerythrin domain-containing protein [Fimbriimonadaceae bacterium]